MNIQMIALKAHPNAGRRMDVGVEFSVPTKAEARVLHGMGLADFAPADAEEERPTQEVPLTLAEAAAATDGPTPADAGAALATKPRRTYRRRDMQAEGSAK